MEKPEFLYHSSQNQNIEIFEPRNESIRNPEEGPVIFATPYIDYAACFIVPTDDSWVVISRWSSPKKERSKWTMVISDKQRFLDLDKGGAIYTLPTKTFYLDKKYSTSDKEWTSKVSVKPTKKEVYKSGLSAMVKHGVNVYFCDMDIVNKIYETPDDGPDILSKLEAYT